MKVFYYFNVQTFLALAISQVAAFLTISNGIKFHVDLLLFGLCIVFPLHFSMQAAFKRRDRALEYFSLFKSGSMALHYSFQIADGLTSEKKKKSILLVKGVGNRLIEQLEFRLAGYSSLQEKISELFAFIETNREEISNRNTLRMIRYLRDLTESSAYLLSLVNHRTIAGLRFYSAFFIIIFPLIQAPILLHHLDAIVPAWSIYIILGMTSLILVTLNNFQTRIEYPFDSKGMDNISIKDFLMDIPA